MSQQDDDTSNANDIPQDETSQHPKLNSDSKNSKKNYPDDNEEEKMDVEGDLQEMLENSIQQIAFFW